MSTDRTFEASVTRFVMHLRTRHYAPRTIDNYRGTLAHFTAFLTERGLRAPHDVAPRDLIGYQTHLLAAGGSRGRALTMNAVANVVSHIKRFFRFLVRTHELLVNPAQDLELPRRSARPPRDVLDPAAVRRLLATPKTRTVRGLRDRAILELLYSTGLRASELAGLAISDIVLEDGELRVRHGKGDRDRLVPVGQVACLWVSRYLKEGRPRLVKHPGESALFLNRRGRRLNRRAVTRIVADAAQGAGLTVHITSHTLRHTFATHMLRGKASIRHVQEILGHARLNTTQIYTHLDISDLKREHRRCHPRGRE